VNKCPAPACHTAVHGLLYLVELLAQSQPSLSFKLENRAPARLLTLPMLLFSNVTSTYATVLLIIAERLAHKTPVLPPALMTDFIGMCLILY
jgi:hypothetical protein